MDKMNVEEKNRFDRMEQHIKEIQKDISNILSALVGTAANGNVGVIHELKEVKEKLGQQELKIHELVEENIKNQHVISILKWVLGLCTAVAGGAILIFLNKR